MQIETMTKPRIFSVDPEHISEESMREVAEILRLGGMIAYPTETVYGLGGDPLDRGVIRRIHDLKGRGDGKPFLLLVGSESSIKPYVREIPDPAVRLMERFWPGPLTLVFLASESLSSPVKDNNGKIGLRLSSDPVCAALLRAFGKPLISTSANPSGREPARSVRGVLSYFPTGLDAILDAGERRGMIPSTLVDVSLPIPRLLRKGPVSEQSIRSAIGELDESETI